MLVIDSNMLNLLPPKQKRELRLDLLNQAIAAFGIAAILVVLILTLVLAIALFYLNINLAQLEKELVSWQAKSEIEELENLEEKVKEVNQNLAFLEEYQEERVEFSLMLEILAQGVPSGIRFNNMSLEKSGKASIRGYALTRDILLTFKNNLERAPYVSDFDFPLSNLTKSEDIDFYLSFIFLD